MIAGKAATLQFHISNTGYAYNGKLLFTVSRNDETVHTSAAQNAIIDRDDEAVIEFTEIFELPTASDYTVSLLDGDGNVIGQRDNLTFTADAPALELTGTTSVPETVNCNEATEYLFGIRNTGFRFDSTLHFVIMLDGDLKFTSGSTKVILARGEERTVTFNETINIPDSNDYRICLMTEDGTTVGERNIEVQNFSGINLLEPDGDVPVRYFNLQGAEIRQPEPGQPVIIVKGTKALKSIFR